jgi:hypothetical protein
MTQPAQSPLYELQRITAQNYVTLLNHISQLGEHGFLAMIDEVTEEELKGLLQACSTVYETIQRHRAKQMGG